MTGFDPATPNTARVYSRLLGGKDHFPADRAEADVLLGIYPPLAEMVQENRAFLAEAVTWAAGQGIGQFLDLGAGLPTTPAIHQIAQEVLPGARVAYVDNDPVVLAHARALLAAPGVAAVAADLRDPAAVLADPDLRAVIDPAEPACVILGAVLHFLDADTARDVTAGYARLTAPGSCLVISCASYDDETLAKRLTAEYTAGQFVNHTREDVQSFFAGLDLVGPGVTEAQTWRAWMTEPVLRHREGHVLAGVARARMPGLQGRQPSETGDGSALFRSLGDPARLAILRQLAGGEARVVDLTALLGLAQSTVSRHLACLRDCGLVTVRPAGRASVYSLAQPALLQARRGRDGAGRDG